MESEIINLPLDEQSKIQGKIIYKRKFGKKLAFLYILCEDKSEVEVMLKECDYVNTTSVGQLILVEGSFQSQFGKRPFVPICLTILEEPGLNENLNQIRKVMIKNTQKQMDKRAICKSFKINSMCQIPNCTFRHFLLEGEEDKLKKLENNKIEAFNKVHVGDPHQSDSKLKKIQRHKLFVEFLVDKFGLDNLKSGHVLDIAGGKGMVSFHLTVTYGVKCIIVDPRGVTLPTKQMKVIKKSNLQIQEIRSYFNENFDESLIRDASLIIGMHPDEATFDIVKTSCKFNKNFAVVPCCVFPTLFSDRVLSNGEKVIEYTQLMKFIQEYIGDADVDFLKMEGRNKVLFKKFYKN